MGIGKFQPPTKSIPLNTSTKNSAQLITSERGPPIPNLVQIHPWGILGKWVKYNKKYFLFIYTFFLRLAYRTDPLKIFMRDSSKDVKSLKDVPFGGLNDVLLNFGVKNPKKLKFWGRE